MRLNHLVITIAAAIALLVCVTATIADGGDLSPYVTATVDGGTGKSLFTFYQQGFNPEVPTSGLPPPGLVQAVSDRASTFLFQPYASNNNVLLLDKANPRGKLSLLHPTPAQSLAFATTSGNGPGTVLADIHFSDGSADVAVLFDSLDWFNAGDRAIVAASGRVWVARGTFESAKQRWLIATNPYPHPAPYIGMAVVTLKELSEAHPVSSIDVTLISGGPELISAAYGPLNTHTAIFGISTSPTLTGPYAAAPLTANSFNQDIVVEANQDIVAEAYQDKRSPQWLRLAVAGGCLLVLASLCVLLFRRSSRPRTP